MCPTGPTSPNRVVIPKRTANKGQEEISQEELASVIAERQEELQQLMERVASGRAPEEKSKVY